MHFLRLKSKNHRRVVWVIGALLFSIWCFVAAWSYFERQRTLSENTVHLRALRAAVQSQAKSLFKQAEYSLLVANHWIETHPTEDPATNQDFIELVEQLRKASQGLLDVRMATADGQLRYVPDRGLTKGVNVADRDYFQAQNDAKTRGFYISKPVRSRMTKKWGIPVSAPVVKGGGNVSVTFIAMEYEKIAATFDDERIQPFGTIGIARLDGEIIFRSPVSEDAIGKSLAAGAGWAKINAFPAGGEYESPDSIIDGRSRFVSYGRVDGYPLIVYVSDTKEELLQSWRQHTAILSLVAGMISIFGVMMGVALLRALTASRVAEAIIETSDEAIIAKSLTGVVLSWNKGAERIFGYKDSEMVGQSILKLVPPELAAEESYILDRVNRGEGVDHLETTRIRKDGQRISVSVTTSPTWDGYGNLIGASKIARDITAQKLATEQLKLTASVFTNASEGILIADRQGIIIEVNEAFSQITGYARDDVVGFDHSKFRSSRQGPEVFKSLRKSLLRRGEWKGELWSRKKDGEAYSVWLTVTKVRTDNGKVRNYLALFSDITVLKLQQEKLAHGAHFDALTNLPNRLLLSDRLHQAMTMCQRNNRSLAVLYLDLDGFKAVNDRYGHKAGDELLVAVSNRMQAALREVDTLARMGGDEFVAVLADLDSTQDCIQLVARVLAACGEPVTIHGHKMVVTASIGVTMYPQDDAEPDQLMRHADQAMYEAKQNGKNKFHLFDSAQEAEVKSRSLLQDAIAQALQRGEFVLFYQPKVNMRTGEVIGAEALIRWQHPDKGLLPPSAFLSAIENHPLNEAVGAWVIHAALEQMARWNADGLPLFVSVNISARQLQHPDFANTLRDLLSRHPTVDANQLELEVLETSALNDIGSTSEILEACLELGVHFAIDDFGTGYSSLTYLRHLPVETLKIDQSFVRDMLHDKDDLAIVKGVIGLAQAFDRVVIAEGVETVAHGSRLIELGCELAQGYQIARPMEAGGIADWCASWRPPLPWTEAVPAKAAL
jgi:diguanylate cyclase (GGDEF)-like protein/PAS domain S-box-containing protein